MIAGVIEMILCGRDTDPVNRAFGIVRKQINAELDVCIGFRSFKSYVASGAVVLGSEYICHIYIAVERHGIILV